MIVVCEDWDCKYNDEGVCEHVDPLSGHKGIMLVVGLGGQAICEDQRIREELEE